MEVSILVSPKRSMGSSGVVDYSYSSNSADRTQMRLSPVRENTPDVGESVELGHLSVIHNAEPLICGSSLDNPSTRIDTLSAHSHSHLFRHSRPSVEILPLDNPSTCLDSLK